MENGYLSQCIFQKSYCDVEVTVETIIKTLPCSKATNSRSEDIKTVKVGEKLTATGLYNNTADNWWYRVDLGNGEIGYVFSGSTKLLQYKNGAYISNPVGPEALNVGDRFSIKGVVSSDLTELVQVGATIQQNGTTLYQAYQNVYSGASYNLLNSQIDMGMLFNELSEGWYTYQVYVGEENNYANGTELHTEVRWPAVYTKEFKVGNPDPTPDPTPDSGNISTAQVTAKLASLKSKLNGKYWNYYDRSVWDSRRTEVENNLKAIVDNGYLDLTNPTNAQLGVTDTACAGSLYESGCRSNYFSGGWQCFGFAWWLEYALFGSTYQMNANDWYVYSGSALNSISLQPGDLIRVNNHSIVISDLSDGRLNCVEAWGGSGCKISWSPGFNWSEYTTPSAMLSATINNGGTVYRYKHVTDGNPVNVPVTSVELNRTSVSLTKPSSVNLTATVYPENATNQDVAWTSSNLNVAIVDQTGHVIPVSDGTAVITVTTKDGGFTAECTVTINYFGPQYLDAYTYTVQDGKATITAVDTSISGDIYIPVALDGYPVIGIAASAFRDCDRITSVTFQDFIESVSVSAFRGCSSLKAFKTLASNLHYSSRDGVLYNKNYSELKLYPLGKTDDSFTIPAGVTSIGNGAFSDCVSLISVTIPASVDTIGREAFHSCKNLKNVIISDGVRSIGSDAFKYCENLLSVTIPNSVESMETDAFRDCSRLTIYVHTAAKPSGWHEDWNSSGRPVVWKYVEPTGVVLNKTVATLTSAGAQVQLEAVLNPVDATKIITWKSSNTSVATVDANGKVTAVSDGIAMITATASSGVSAMCKIYVGERSGAGYGNFRTYFTSCPSTLNPLVTQDTNPWTILEATGITLYRTVINGTKDGYVWDVNLAASMPIKVDSAGYIWQYTISPDAVWEDGTPITVDDIEFMLKQFADPLQQNLYASSITMSSYGVIKNIYEYQKGEVKDWSEVAYTKIDDYTFRVEFTWPITQYDAIRALNQPLLYAPLYNAGLTADGTATTYGTSLATYMSAGPFILTEWIPDAKFVLTKNPDYIHADEISLESITYIMVPDTSTAVQLFEKGELDYASISFSMWQTYEDDARLYEYFNDSLMYMLVNWGNPRGNNLLGNLKFRQALHYGMDRVEIANTLHVYPATRIVRKAVMTSPASGKLFVDVPQNYVEDGYTVRNTTKALQLLTQAFEENDVESFELRILTSDTANARTSHSRAASDILMSQYNNLFKGKMTTVYQVVPSGQITSLRRYNPNNPGAFDTAIASLLPSATDPRATFNYYRSNYTPPRFCYGDPVFDNWYAEAMSYDLQKDTDKVVELCQKMEEKLLSELAVIPVYETATKVLFSEDVVLPAGGYVPGYGWGIIYASMIAPIQHVESVSLDKTSVLLTAAGESVRLTATVLPENAINKTVNWTSSNTSVATVDADGKVTAVSDGIATITATTADGGKTAICTVTVNSSAPKAVVNSSSARAGETVTVDIVLSGAPNLETLGASDIIYDTDVLELIGFEWKVKEAFLSNWDSATGMGAVIYSSPADLNGTIISLSFKVKDSAEDGDYTVSCTVISHESDLANISGKITVYSVVPGDLDGNEGVDKADAIRLMMHIMFPSVYPVNQNADFTGDMVVDKADAIYLMMHIMFPSTYPLK